MAFSHGSQAAIFGNGYALCPWTKSVSSGAQVTMENTTVLCNTSGAQSYMAGLEDGTLSIEGLWDGAADAIDEILDAAFTAGAIFTHCPQGDVTGYPAFGLSAVKASHDVQTPGNTLSKFSASAQSNYGWERGLIYEDTVTINGTSNGTTIDNGALTANGGVAYLQVLDYGSGTQTVKVQHSADGVTYADLITFTVTALGAQRTAATGTVQRHVRVSWAITDPLQIQLMFKRY